MVMAWSEVLSFLVLILLCQGYEVGGNQNPDTKRFVSSVVGCNAELIWEWPGKATRASVAKSQNSHEELRVESNDKYRIDRTTERVTLTMYNVTMVDTAVYISRLGSEKKDVNLAVTDFRWQNEIRTKYVRVGEAMTLLWAFVTKVTARTIRLHRKLPSTNGAPPQDLVQWENGAKKTLIEDNRMMFNLDKAGNDDMYRVNFTIRDTKIDDLKYIYNIEVKFNDNCLKTEKPVELMEDFDFKWLPSQNSVISTIYQPVELVWKYHSLKLANKIIFTRYYNLTKKKTQLGMWTIERGFEYKADGIVFNKSNTNQEETIIMTIKMVTNKDFDHFYECRVFCGILFNSVSGIELLAELPHISSDKRVIKSRPTENITFVWSFRYKFPVLWVILTRSNRSNGEDNQIGFIYNKTLTVKLLVNDGNRIRGNVTEKEEDNGYIYGQITLSLLNTTKDDFSYKYYVCRIAFIDKQSSERHSIILEEKDVARPGVTDKEEDSLSAGHIAAIVVVPIVIIGIFCLVLYLLKYRTKKKDGDLLPVGFMKYPHYRVWVKNNNDLLHEIQKDTNKVARQFSGDNIIDATTSESLQNVAKASKRNSAIQLMDLLVKQGENVLPKIITSLKKCGLKTIGHKLETDFERNERMKDEDYKLWRENYLGLVAGLLNALPKITPELLKRQIIDSRDLEDLDIHRAIGKREGAIKLVNILCQRGRDVLPKINLALEACGLHKIERANVDGEPMKYDHYIVWIKHKTYLMESFKGKLSDITEKLVQNDILDEGKRTEIMKIVMENESKGAYKLVDMVCSCGESVLPKIIQILNDPNLALSEVVKKLEMDLRRTGRMKDNDYRVWVNNGTYIVTNIHYNLHIVSKMLLEKHIIDDVDMKEFDSHRQIGRRLGAVKLVDILSERGEDVLGKIIDTFEECGFTNVADELKKDLSRRVRMIDWHYKIWVKNKSYLTDNMKDSLPCLTRELYKAEIIDMVDWEQTENAAKEKMENGAEKLENILCNRGENVLPGILLVFNRCGLFDVVERLKKDINRRERMNYIHFKIWNKNKDTLITNFRNKHAMLIEELKNSEIIDEDDVTELRPKEESGCAKKLVDMLDKRGKDALPEIIKVLEICGLTEVATKLTTDISRLEKMEPKHYEIWEERYNYLVEHFKNNLDRLTAALNAAYNIIDDEDLDNILNGSKEDGAIKLIDILGYRGKDILPKIIEVLKSCGLFEVAVELETDLSTDDNNRRAEVTENTPLMDTDTHHVTFNIQQETNKL
ncbi:uncharacterized protein LOC126830606 [Patella vulgata]|uniref:uncharacterized protein LOC126830606 n=1 Tax=Patella vulgata TaxID=6465 RepID=UPI00217F90BF|nr:uncharacterized protein LOC126830606 [Patella vulgata]XP_050416960.1 uncharacterized protein LOC126830606 [Patella vulgata]